MLFPSCSSYHNDILISIFFLVLLRCFTVGSFDFISGFHSLLLFFSSSLPNLHCFLLSVFIFVLFTLFDIFILFLLFFLRRFSLFYCPVGTDFHGFSFSFIFYSFDFIRYLHSFLLQFSVVFFISFGIFIHFFIFFLTYIHPFILMYSLIFIVFFFVHFSSFDFIRYFHSFPCQFSFFYSSGFIFLFNFLRYFHRFLHFLFPTF